MFRPCPSFPGFSVTLDGVVRREAFAFINKTGKVIHHKQKVLARVGRNGMYVLISQKQTYPEDLVYDAWHHDHEELKPREKSPRLWHGWCHCEDYHVRTIERPSIKDSKKPS
jgi:hypothetical protein